MKMKEIEGLEQLQKEKQLEISQMSGVQKAQEAEIVRVKSQLDEEQRQRTGEVKQINEQLSQVQNQLLVAEKQQALFKELSSGKTEEMTSELQAREEEISTLKEQRNILVNQLELDKEELQKGMDEQSNALRSKGQDVSDLQIEIKQMDAKMAELQRRQQEEQYARDATEENLKVQLKALEEQLESKSEDLSNYLNESDQLKIILKSKDAEIAENLKEIEGLKKDKSDQLVVQQKLEKELNSLQETLNSKITEHKARVSEMELDFSQRFSTNQADWEKKLTLQQDTIKQINAQLDENSARHSVLQQEKQDLAVQLEDSKIAIENLRKIEETQVEQLEALSRSKTEKQSLLEKMQAVAKNTEAEWEAAKIALEDTQEILNNGMSEKGKLIQELKVENAKLGAESQHQQSSIKSLELELEKLSESETQKKRELEMAHTLKSELRDEITGLKKSRQSWEQEEVKLNQKATGLSAELTAKNTLLLELQAKHEAALQKTEEEKQTWDQEKVGLLAKIQELQANIGERIEELHVSQQHFQTEKGSAERIINANEETILALKEVQQRKEKELEQIQQLKAVEKKDLQDQLESKEQNINSIVRENKTRMVTVLEKHEQHITQLEHKFQHEQERLQDLKLKFTQKKAQWGEEQSTREQEVAQKKECIA